MTDPTNPIAAVTNPNPYPYYARLVAERPIYRDAALGLWVVSSAGAVTAVLTNADCRVRPAAEPVPETLVGSPAGDIFGRLVRMNDGERHRPVRLAVATTLATVDLERVGELSRYWASRLAEQRTDVAFNLSVHVLGGLLGIPDDKLGQTAGWVSDFVRCLAPSSTPAQVEQGAQAAGRLHEMFATLLDDTDDGLLNTLAREAQRADVPNVDSVVANGIGFLWQAHDATAGLIGNTLVRLANDAELRERLAAEPALIDAILLEVLRYDPPIQNTRRFVANDTTVAGQQLCAGDAILVVLAAANRDPAANPNPDRFDIDRQDRKSFTFGAGTHACPGSALAVTIARAAVEQLLAVGMLPQGPVRYYQSTNARIPHLSWNWNESETR